MVFGWLPSWEEDVFLTVPLAGGSLSGCWLVSLSGWGSIHPAMGFPLKVCLSRGMAICLSRLGIHLSVHLEIFLPV